MNLNLNLLAVLLFFLVLVAFFWLMPNNKIEVIGDFFQKIITPNPILWLVISSFGLVGLGKYLGWKRKSE